MLEFKGKIVTGIRAVELLDGGVVSRIISNKADPSTVLGDGKVVRLSSSARLVIHNNRIVGTRGARKFFFSSGDGAGVLIYVSLGQGRLFKPAEIDRESKAIKLLVCEGLFPVGEMHRINLDFEVRNYHPKGKSKQLISGVYYGYRTDEIVYPDYVFQGNCNIDLFVRLWNNKRIKPMHLTLDESRVLYGDEFLSDNPDFCLGAYDRFCNKVRKIFNKSKMLKRMRGKPNPDLKYSNVLYCSNKKRWFWLDFT